MLMMMLMMMMMMMTTTTTMIMVRPSGKLTQRFRIDDNTPFVVEFPIASGFSPISMSLPEGHNMSYFFTMINDNGIQ